MGVYRVHCHRLCIPVALQLIAVEFPAVARVLLAYAGVV